MIGYALHQLLNPEMQTLTPIEQTFARLFRIAFTVWKQMDAEVAPYPAPPYPAPPQAAPSPATPPQITTYGDPAVPIDATKRIRRTKAQIAADAAAAALGAQPDLTAAPAPAPTAAPTAAPAPAPAPAPAEMSADARKALRLELSEAVRASLAMNGEQETVSRLGYAKISLVPDSELVDTIKRMKA